METISLNIKLSPKVGIYMKDKIRSLYGVKYGYLLENKENIIITTDIFSQNMRFYRSDTDTHFYTFYNPRIQ